MCRRYLKSEPSVISAPMGLLIFLYRGVTHLRVCVGRQNFSGCVFVENGSLGGIKSATVNNR